MSNMDTIKISGPGTFQFSAIRPEELPEDEYTIVNIVDDVSPSTESFRKEACEARKKIVEACKKSPRAEKLLIRFVTFGSTTNETHGYKPLSDIDINDYKPEDTIGASTALYDATYEGVSSVIDYSKLLDDSADINSNGIVFVVTDGMDNNSTMGPQSILDKIKDARMSESIESLRIVLVGINDPNSGWSQTVTRALSEFQAEAEIDQFVDAGDATPQKLAKLANFVSESISSQSQSLGTGGGSQGLTF